MKYPITLFAKSMQGLDDLVNKLNSRGFDVTFQLDEKVEEPVALTMSAFYNGISEIKRCLLGKYLIGVFGSNAPIVYG